MNERSPELKPEGGEFTTSEKIDEFIEGTLRDPIGASTEDFSACQTALGEVNLIEGKVPEYMEEWGELKNWRNKEREKRELALGVCSEVKEQEKHNRDAVMQYLEGTLLGGYIVSSKEEAQKIASMIYRHGFLRGIRDIGALLTGERLNLGRRVSEDGFRSSPEIFVDDPMEYLRIYYRENHWKSQAKSEELRQSHAEKAHKVISGVRAEVAERIFGSENLEKMEISDENIIELGRLIGETTQWGATMFVKSAYREEDGLRTVSVPRGATELQEYTDELDEVINQGKKWTDPMTAREK